ncbi:MAG TPA: winged helix-turn-helix domain-containing protein [Vicinamibacteria bacterium]|nr:winged helix-turn-helix domain-containing protein [Vicinamibacteria bacterium]
MTDRASILEFGPYRLDARRRLVWKGDALLDVPPKAAELLAALAGEAGEVVSKEELLQRVWPDTFVEEANLSVNVSILRKALGEQSDGRPWIQTVARRGYRFLGAVRAQAAAPRSLAVLPFRSLGTDEADDALGLGMADALITRLAATGRVAVRPTGTVRRFASPDVDPVEAGRQLGVDAVVDGRLQRSGSRLRLTVQLVPTAGGAPLWADQFDEEFTHLFAVEDTVAERVAVALVAELSAEERQRLGRRQTDSLEAYQAYCRGRFFWGRFSRPWVEKAMLSFHEATAHDPRYALPHAGLADAFLVAGFAGALPPREAWALAAESSRAALGLDDRIPEPHVSAGFLRLLQEWDWNGAERELRRAIELAPDSAAPHQWLGLVLDLRGRKDDAVRALRRAEELDPLSLVVSALVGLHRAFGGEHEAELAQARRTLELDPHQFLGHWAVGSALQNLGRHDEAAAEHQRALDLAEGTAFMKPVLARSLALAGRVGEARALLVPEGPADASPYQAATVHLALGETDRALELLAAAAEQRDPWIVLLAVDPLLRPLRGHPDYEALVKRVRGD